MSSNPLLSLVCSVITMLCAIYTVKSLKSFLCDDVSLKEVRQALDERAQRVHRLFMVNIALIVILNLPNLPNLLESADYTSSTSMLGTCALAWLSTEFLAREARKSFEESDRRNSY